MTSTNSKHEYVSFYKVYPDTDDPQRIGNVAEEASSGLAPTFPFNSARKVQKFIGIHRHTRIQYVQKGGSLLYGLPVFAVDA